MAEVSKATKQAIAQHVTALLAAQEAVDVAVNTASLSGTAEMLMISLNTWDLGGDQDEVSRRHRNPPAVAAARKALDGLLTSIGVPAEAWAQVYANALRDAKQDAKQSGGS